MKKKDSALEEKVKKNKINKSNKKTSKPKQQTKKIRTSDKAKTNFIHCSEDQEIQKKCNDFNKKINSKMHYKSDLFGNALSFDWIDVIETACPFIDNVIRVPKLTLVQEEYVVKIEKAKKTGVASVKNLAKHTNYISKIDKETQDVQPEKIMEIRNEETFNIYENRFLYTLLDVLNRFLIKKEEMLNNFEINDNKVLEYSGTSVVNDQKIKLDLRITSNELPKGDQDDNIAKDIDNAKKRVKRIREYLTSWQRSAMYKALAKAHIPLIHPPIKKTNIIIHNPNFQVAVKLWDFLQTYDYTVKDTDKNIIDTDGDDNLVGFLDHSFLIDFFVLDSISSKKRNQREKMSKYAIYIITHEIYKTIELLMNCGIKISDDELISMVSRVIKDEKSNRLVGASDVKKKFESEIDDYLERMQNLL